MNITHELSINAPLRDVWPVITDPGRAVAALPGATLDEVDGDTFRGSLGVKLGPMNLRYAGEGSLRHDAAKREVVIDGKGTEQRGSGGVTAKITAGLSELPAERTGIVVTVDLDLTGKPAQFGRGILGEVVKRMAATFVKRLEEIVQQSSTAPAAVPPSSPVAVTTAAPESKRTRTSVVAALRPYLPAAAVVLSCVATTVLMRRVVRVPSAPRLVVIVAEDSQQATEIVSRLLH